ncbi:MAG TPA: ribonuclease Z [Flavitalea sp.]|nr:ribonuclease Z [Flavitalea sp.]
MLGVTILGNNSALPAFDRHPTSQLVTLEDQLFLVDCGEGTQVQLARYKIRWGRINHIFISHLHGDHYFGLPGFVHTMGLLNRENDLHLYAPAPLKEILDLQFLAAGSTLPFTLHFHPLEGEGELVRTEKCRISCFPTMHRVPCWGFLFEQVRPLRKVNIDKARIHNVPAVFFDRLKKGEDFINGSGTRIPNAIVTDPVPKPKSYAFCADTMYDETLAEKLTGVDMIYHETTYLKDLNERAAARFHSTTEQAALIAKAAHTKRLLIGHFSSKYDKLDQFEQEARSFFPDTDLALEGVTYYI